MVLGWFRVCAVICLVVFRWVWGLFSDCFFGWGDSPFSASESHMTANSALGMCDSNGFVSPLF